MVHTTSSHSSMSPVNRGRQMMDWHVVIRSFDVSDVSLIVDMGSNSSNSSREPPCRWSGCYDEQTSRSYYCPHHQCRFCYSGREHGSDFCSSHNAERKESERREEVSRLRREAQRPCAIPSFLTPLTMYGMSSDAIVRPNVETNLVRALIQSLYGIRHAACPF